MRAAIYARYSSENQREASLEDQTELCRRYAERQGWTVVQVYSDRAASGASTFARPGFLKMLSDAESGWFDVLICEAIDRLGRKLADVADLFDRLTFRRVAVHATSLGLVTQMHVGIMGTMAQMTLSDLREKTKRGQLGRAREGRIPGGLAYGYDVVPPAPGSKDAGERRINQAEAEVVRRIFRDYAAGKSPRRIAHELNAEGIPGPGGRNWGDTTLRGQPERGTGLLNNTLYIGMLSWNRCSYVKDPRTGRRIARVNPVDQREHTAVPDLRIVDQALWEATQDRRTTMAFGIGRSESGEALNRAHRRKFLLSGLLRCGYCGGGYTIIGPDQYGCAARRSKGTCTNNVIINRARIEKRVLDALKGRMLAPELVAEFVKAFTEEVAAAQRTNASTSDASKRELSDVQRRLEGVLRAVENGAWSTALQTRLHELEQRKSTLEEAVQAAEAPAPVIRLHPNVAGLYRQKVEGLEAALSDPAIRTEAIDALSAMIEAVVLTPDAEALDGLSAELHGDLAIILAAAGGEGLPVQRAPSGRGLVGGRVVSGGVLSVVAGTGFEPVTFRL